MRIDSGKPAKANVSLDAGTLQAIDEEAAAHLPDALSARSLQARRLAEDPAPDR